MMEYWRQCALWLINCKVLPANHRVTWDSAQVFDLAQTLRDGVLLCHLLNNLRPQTINLKEINLRPQMSQFLCLKNIRTFLAACSDVFGMKKSELFEAFDLFDVRDFGKVRHDCYSVTALFFHLSCSENGVEDEEDLYDCVYDDEEGGEIYEDLMKTEAVPPPVYYALKCLPETLPVMTLQLEAEITLKSCDARVCLHLLLESKIKPFFQSEFSILLILVFVQECSKRANYGKFTLRDLLVVPMQRVLKYHLLLQELVKHTHDGAEKTNLRTALDAMKDLAQYVNEVKRDNETLREIDQYQKSIENLNQRLSNYGRPKVDGEVRVASVDKRAKQDRHIFLFDAAVIVCKRRGDNYEMKEVIDLHLFKVTNNPTSDKENRKWSYGFYLTHNQGQSGFEFFFKTKDLKKKWLEQFSMAISNIRPENATNNHHEFRMHTFERITSCNSCHMLLRGVFYQGYWCSKCGLGAHKECLGRFGCCGKTDSSFTHAVHLAGLPKMLVIRNYFGSPSPASGPALHIQTGDIIELICADIHSPWWQGKILSTKEVGFFPSDAVKPFLVFFTTGPVWLLCCRFAGPMERLQAEAELINRVNSTYLVRHRSREYTEYAISIKYNNDVKHIKILTKEGSFYIAENKKFRSIVELIEYYKHHSLREGFRSLDTTLQFPYRETENAAMHLIGVAIARYDFSSRDTRELSLQEGDVVKIYTKSGANGWWRGEVNGRVSGNLKVLNGKLWEGGLGFAFQDIIFF
uniref:Vav guanine nucleotide exchange factor 3 n=1 Tax=Astatotilapia calliptera TaxID=8154 RepID=A0AAX7U7X6_ASTCA